MDDDQIIDLHTRLLNGLDERRFARAIPLEAKELRDRVADNPTKSYVVDADGRRVGVLIVSNPVGPHLVAASVAKAREASQALGEMEGAVVLEPLADGVFSDLSYVLWPLRRALSPSRIVRYFQKRSVRPKVFRWLEAATRKSLCPEVGPDQTQALYTVPLEKIAENRQMSARLRESATRGLDRLAAGTMAPVAVLQHSDLWLGNILLPLRDGEQNSGAPGFYVIDWPGATLTGHPFFDLLRFGESTGISAKWMRWEIETHCRIIGCEPEDSISYASAALGIIGMNLEHFPEARYLEMSERVLETASAALAT